MKKGTKWLSRLLAAVMVLSMLPAGALAAEQTAEAMPTNDSLTVNGVLQTPTVYKINGFNYFKIRDVAAVLNGTGKQFSVGYDDGAKSVTATTGQAYTMTDTELKGAPAGGNKTAELSNDVIYVNGVRTEAEVYKIDGSNYFKLRDLGDALGFEVNYSAEKGVFIDTEPALTLSDDPLYEDSNVKITFLRAEKSRYDSGEAVVYLDVDNKTSQKLTVQCDAVSLNGYCFNEIVMSDDVAANSIGTVDVTLENFDFDLVDVSKIETVGGQFRIIPGGVFDSSGDSYNAIFPAKNLYTNKTDDTIPSAGSRELLYSDKNVEFYFDHAEKSPYSSGNDEIEVYLMVRNKTSKTLLIQNDTIVINRRSYERTVMSDPVLAHSTGYVNVSVREYNGSSPETITTVGGDFRVIDDTGRDRTYTATMGSISDVGSDNTTDPGTTPTGGTTVMIGKYLYNKTPGTKDPGAVYPNVSDPVPDFGGIYGLTPDPTMTTVEKDDQKYWYYFDLGSGGFTRNEVVRMRNEYLSRYLVGNGFSNKLGTFDISDLDGDSAFDQFVKVTDHGRLAVHFNFAVSNELNIAYIIVSVSYF